MTPDAILDFWFADGPDTPRKAWFEKNASFDDDIRGRFSGWLPAARDGTLDGWAATPGGALALLILLDQFPRNLFRGTGDAFAYDAHARDVARGVMARMDDWRLTPTQRTFAYLPFEHSETMADQDLSVALFGGLRDVPALLSNVGYAWRHHAVIARFGRFPHRNAALCRVNTPAEVAYLAQPGAGF